MKLRVPKKAVACGILAAALSASMAAHANLVTNGGFETGDFTGWSASIDPVWDSVYDGAPQAGTYAGSFGNPGSSTISQTLATAPSTTYKLTFWLQAEADVNGLSAPNSFSFSWDGAPGAPTLVDSPAFGYTEFQYVLVASSASTTLSFTFSNEVAFWDFDSVDVETVPEPASLALALGALAGLWAVSRRSAARAGAARSAS